MAFAYVSSVTLRYFDVTLHLVCVTLLRDVGL